MANKHSHKIFKKGSLHKELGIVIDKKDPPKNLKTADKKGAK